MSFCRKFIVDYYGLCCGETSVGPVGKKWLFPGGLVISKRQIKLLNARLFEKMVIF